MLNEKNSNALLKTSKLRQSARGRECQIRIPRICNHDNDTTVLAHLNGGGLSLKNPDFIAAFSCSNCHDVIDGRVTVHPHDQSSILLMFHQGIVRTQKIWLREGFVTHD